MQDVWLLRVGILAAGAILVGLIWYFGTRPRGGQGRRTATEPARGRSEPSLGAALEAEAAGAEGSEDVVQQEMELLDGAIGSAGANADLGRRINDQFDRIVTLYIAARAGQLLHGPDIVVAAEKAGLACGHMQVFHRLLEGHPEQGPVFSVANIQKPGGFDMARIQSLETPAIAFFLTLPAPIGALDAWDAMLPTAQRMAELLDGVLLDEQRNALGRQRIAHLRDEMRAWDRQHGAQAAQVTRSPRW